MSKFTKKPERDPNLAYVCDACMKDLTALYKCDVQMAIGFDGKCEQCRTHRAIWRLIRGERRKRT